MPDLYQDFAELSAAEVEGTDYRIIVKDRGTSVAVLAIHGGEIEPDTEKVAESLAGLDHSLYIFLGNSEHQHMTSTHFDEPRCINLVAKCTTAISIHGKGGDGEFVILGGLNNELIHRVTSQLRDASFEIKDALNSVAGIKLDNICNKCASGRGLQIEMSRELRRSLVQDPARMASFTQAIRKAI